MLYNISRNHTGRHLIEINFIIENLTEEKTYLNLPAWRPGRYEMANFSKNIYQVSAKTSDGQPLPIEKTSKDRWEVINGKHQDISVHYLYYANQMDGGGSVLDDKQLYINFINCLLYVAGRLEEPCRVKVALPEEYIIACGLPQKENGELLAESYYHLVDSPLMASPNLQHLSYKVDDYNFHIWINGNWKPEEKLLLSYFKAFTEVQIQTMEGFPCENYHFLFQILPYRFYHGVEHYNSTVIVLGPDEDIESLEGMEHLLGVSAHELFHTWNIIRIRPKEMFPYRFNEENYFKTGFVAEGFTTYYGDLFLLRGKVFSKSEYFENLNKSLKRHFDNFGRFNLSLADSSYDLWLDGYSNATPDRKVSIYVKGSLVALMLDLTIRKYTSGEKSLDDLMRILWKEFGLAKKGYSESDIKNIAERLSNVDMTTFFEKYIFGTIAIEEELSQLLKFIGCNLVEIANHSLSEGLFGFKTQQKDQATVVSTTIPNSIADKYLSNADELIAIDGKKISNNLEKLLKGKKNITLSFFRNHQLYHEKLESSEERYGKQYEIIRDKSASQEARNNFREWAQIDW